VNTKTYWEQYYNKNPDPFVPSAFAMAVTEFIEDTGLLIELGCGNGRDALFLSRLEQLNVLAIDQCEKEIARLADQHGTNCLKFIAANFVSFAPSSVPRYVYSRWTLHAIDEKDENETIKWVTKHLCSGGRLFIEARSIKDDLYGVGVQVGHHAFVSDHYRRFIDLDELSVKLQDNGYRILHSIESRGLAVYNHDDPFLLRLIAEKI
jgi:SAM-dependent methyltransferase